MRVNSKKDELFLEKLKNAEAKYKELLQCSEPKKVKNKEDTAEIDPQLLAVIRR